MRDLMKDGRTIYPSANEFDSDLALHACAMHKWNERVIRSWHSWLPRSAVSRLFVAYNNQRFLILLEQVDTSHEGDVRMT